jgi:tRNA(Ile)-lysidine synthase
MNLLKRFQENIKQQNLFSPKDKLLLAVSGGIDSIVLCELCKQSGFDFIIAHCNFQLRGEESERDEKFVRSLGGKYGVEVLIKKFETEKYAEEKKLSMQEAARDLRYSWFAEIIGNRQYATDNKNSLDKEANWLLTAHHADDNVETLLMIFCRGTGLHGLEGIPVAPLHIRRPLLGFWKEELIEFAKENKLEFVEDSSNQLSKYTRNLFRNEIIPLITKAYPQVKENLNDNVRRFKDISKLYSISVKELKKKLYKVKKDEIHIPVKQLMSYQSRALIFEIISEFGFNEKQLDDVIKLTESESGKYVQSPNAPARIIKFRHWLLISTDKASYAETIIIEENSKEIQFALGTLLIETTSNLKLQTSNLAATLEAKTIHFPLILRKWKQGDYFYPLGMKNLPAGRQGKKKLARFFIDQKLSKTEKENAWVLEMEKKIIWVIGYRIDDRFKITDKTEQVLKLIFKQNH